MANDSAPVIAIKKARFDALAGYTRLPQTAVVAEELEWYSIGGDRVLGVVCRDKIDGDFTWVSMARDRLGRFRAIGVETSLQSPGAAREALHTKLTEQATWPDERYHQGDEVGEPVDFFTPLVPRERLHPSFAHLVDDERYSPARDLIGAMMRYHNDVDGNFVREFQTNGFDMRIWELYLFAVLVELGYARNVESDVPDFIGEGLLGKLGIEAVSANPTQGEPPRPPPKTNEEFKEYFENHIPLKLARSLTRKLDREKPYWEVPAMKDAPFLIAIQDFHARGAMKMIVPTVTEYVFGYRHSMVDGVLHIERIKEHRFRNAAEPSGFFFQPKSENVSAVLVNPQGTLMKFNRLGFIEGFGSERVKMVRSGMLRREGYPDGPQPRAFRHAVTRQSEENWIQGMVVLHNPNAKIPLHPDQLPGANHEFVREDGRIMSLLPDFHPYFSETLITIEDDNAKKTAN